MADKILPDIEIRRITPAELDDVTRLWRDTFGDTCEFVQDFCEAADAFSGEPGTGIWAAFDDGKLCSMASLVPTVLRENGRERLFPYVFAVATSPSYRGRGLAGIVVHTATGELDSCLIPENAGLFDYWRRQGYVAPILSQYPSEAPLDRSAHHFRGDESDMYRVFIDAIGTADAIIRPFGFFALAASEWLRSGCVYSIGDGWAIWKDGVYYDAAGFALSSAPELKGLIRSSRPVSQTIELNNMLEY